MSKLANAGQVTLFRANIPLYIENTGSTLGRWMATHGCAFTVNGVPAGPTNIRIPQLWESA